MAIPYLLRDRLPDAQRAIDEHRRFNEGVVRLDIFGVKQGGAIDGELVAPLRPEIPVLEPGQSYLLEIVIRTVKMGHLFTQGTVDSNQVWMEVTVTDAEREIGSSGRRNPLDNSVDPDAHFVNAYVIDREGNRIDRRNPENIFTSLYNNHLDRP